MTDLGMRLYETGSIDIYEWVWAYALGLHESLDKYKYSVLCITIAI